MVRQIKSCTSCRRRFVSKTASTSQCKRCISGRLTNVGDQADTCPSEYVSTLETSVSAAEVAKSRKPTSSVSLAMRNDISNENTLPIGDQRDVCFICGASFLNISTGLTGRTNHIKRCSKKYGVTGRDVKLNDDDELFKNDNTSGDVQKSAADATSNPYVKKDNSWHEGACVDLSLADEQIASSGTAAATPFLSDSIQTSTKQSHLRRFFPTTKMRSLTNVLLLGSQRAAKTTEIVSKKSSTAGLWDSKQPSSGRHHKRRRIDYTKVYCPKYKKIPGTDFVCDGFMYARSALTKNYFLTHFHSDHYGGITASWNAGIIYCSLATANLVHQQLGVDRKYLHPLSLMTPTIVESLGRPVQVSLMDANHCPGATMFLFEVGKRRILHVGDFRWNRELMLKFAPLQAFSSQQVRLDDLFLDTTYCNEKYQLPSQDEAIQATVELAEKELETAKLSGKKTLFLFGAYTIGKERIYLSVAERLQMKAYVDKQRFSILSALDWPPEKLALLTTVKHETCLWVVPLGNINFKNMPDFLDPANTKVLTRRFDRVVGFRPTGWSISAKGNNIITTRKSGIFTVHSVPYSEHSSFPELVDCIACLRPRNITPTVSVSNSAEQVDRLLKGITQKKLWDR